MSPEARNDERWRGDVPPEILVHRFTTLEPGEVLGESDYLRILDAAQQTGDDEAALAVGRGFVQHHGASSHAPRVLWQVAECQRHAGRVERSTATLRLLIAQFPAHPLAAKAEQRLFSGEAEPLVLDLSGAARVPQWRDGPIPLVKPPRGRRSRRWPRVVLAGLLVITAAGVGVAAVQAERIKREALTSNIATLPTVVGDELPATEEEVEAMILEQTRRHGLRAREVEVIARPLVYPRDRAGHCKPPRNWASFPIEQRAAIDTAVIEQCRGPAAMLEASARVTARWFVVPRTFRVESRMLAVRFGAIREPHFEDLERPASSSLELLALSRSDGPLRQQLDRARGEARDAGKRMFVLLSAPWCGACRTLEAHLKGQREPPMS